MTYYDGLGDVTVHLIYVIMREMTTDCGCGSLLITDN